jgi:hypothetical protein
MYETQILAARALRDLLDNPDRDDWDELLAANRALIKTMETGEPMTQNNARIIAEVHRRRRCSSGSAFSWKSPNALRGRITRTQTRLRVEIAFTLQSARPADRLDSKWPARG